MPELLLEWQIQSHSNLGLSLLTCRVRKQRRKKRFIKLPPIRQVVVGYPGKFWLVGSVKKCPGAVSTRPGGSQSQAVRHSVRLAASLLSVVHSVHGSAEPSVLDVASNWDLLTRACLALAAQEAAEHSG